MKPQVDSVLRHQGNFEGADAAMDIHIDATPHIINLLTDMYSDKLMAVIREYPANAMDSHKAEGQTRPIEVTLPTEDSPTFKVQDWGTGLDGNELLNHFGKYGWSSKRETNDEVGMMGMGCKAGLTLTEQFFVTAVKDGIRNTALVYRDEMGLPRIKITETKHMWLWEAENGVTVHIPISNVWEFNDRAREFFSYWEPGTVLVDGQPPERIEAQHPKAEWLDETILLIPFSERSHGEQNTSDIVVMGNIAYPIDGKHSVTKNLGYSRAVLFVPIGMVSPTPNREALHYNRATESLLDDAREYIASTVFNRAQRELDAAPSGYEAFQVYKRWKRILKGTYDRPGKDTHHALRYHGMKIPEQIKVPRGWIYDPVNNTARNLARNQGWDEESFYYENIEKAVGRTYVVGHPTKTITVPQRDKIAAFLDARPELLDREKKKHQYIDRVGSVLALNFVRSMDWAWPWMEGCADVVQWDEIDATAAAKRARQPKPEPGPREPKYEWFKPSDNGSWFHGHYGTERGDHLPRVKGRLVYVPRHFVNSERGDSYRDNRRLIHDALAWIPGKYLVLVAPPPTKMAEFLAELPTAIPLHEAVAEEFLRIESLLSDIQKTWLTEDSYYYRHGWKPNLLALLDEGCEVLDPRLLEMAQELSRLNHGRYRDRWTYLSQLSKKISGFLLTVAGKKSDMQHVPYTGQDHRPTTPDEVVELLKDYPLLSVELVDEGGDNYDKIENITAENLAEYINTTHLQRRWDKELPDLERFDAVDNLVHEAEDLIEHLGDEALEKALTAQAEARAEAKAEAAASEENEVDLLDDQLVRSIA